MEFFKEFLSSYGTTILGTILTAIAGYIGIVLKNAFTKYINDSTKKSVVKTVIQAVEQIYTDLHGEEKYNKAVEAISEMLAEKSISVTEFEIKMLIESTVNEFNNNFGNIEIGELLKTDENNELNNLN